ncbi:hypothetical protein FA13DRAFT_171651 [Coprinellus micaceus]|uniref:Uncharacterized protein n=1 Tax=Coprinellus micaceus TaxID=71717 RepID=A0A4Y7SGD7_COPMI|nr:hypothetical protein FA13DRAFT_171651 [Coprinellus micaceus]
MEISTPPATRGYTRLRALAPTWNAHTSRPLLTFIPNRQRCRKEPCPHGRGFPFPRPSPPLSSSLLFVILSSTIPTTPYTLPDDFGTGDLHGAGRRLQWPQRQPQGPPPVSAHLCSNTQHHHNPYSHLLVDPHTSHNVLSSPNARQQCQRRQKHRPTPPRPPARNLELSAEHDDRWRSEGRGGTNERG